MVSLLLFYLSTRSDSCCGQEKPSLQKGVWTNVIAIAIARKTKSKCAYVFKRARISGAPFVTIFGRCKAKSCQNKLRAFIQNEPLDDEGIILKVITKDTHNDQHEAAKRPLNGVYRKDVQKQLVHEGTSNFRKRKAREDMVLGDAEPTYLPNAEVLRQAKKQRIDENLGLNPSNRNNLNMSITEIAQRPEFCGKIEFIATLPFMVVYRTPSQLYAYKEYCKKTTNSTLMIDATGSFLQKIVRDDKEQCGPIFLYSMAINFDHTTIPVQQMLSEKHDAHTIMMMVYLFMRAGAPRPKRVICDYSKALLYAVCREFNGQSLKKYMQRSFEKLLANKSVDVPTQIRVDVAHIMNFVSKWKCWRTAAHVEVKQFFLRCVGLMIQSSKIDHFKTVLTYTMVVAGQKYLDSVVEISTKNHDGDEDPSSKSVLGIRNELEKLIGNCSAIVKQIGSDTAAESEHLRPTDHLCDYVKSDCDGENITSAVKWVTDIVATATATKFQGHEMNAFFVPSFIPLLKNLCVEFMIWTNCTTPECDERASSAAIESYFNDLKTNVFGKGLRRADNFLITHLRDIEGACMLFVAKTARHENAESPEEAIHDVSSFCEIEDQNPATAQLDHDAWSIENWKNQVPHSENINPAVEDVDDEESGTLEWSHDHSYCRNVEEPEVIEEVPIDIGCSNAQEKDAKTQSKGRYFKPFAEIRYVNSRIDKKPAATPGKIKPCFLKKWLETAEAG